MTKLIKVIFKNRKLVSKNGKEYSQTMYFLEYGEGRRVAIKPVNNDDYAKLDVLSNIVIDDSVKQ